MALHTTTVRFTSDQWAFIAAEAERLGIARSAYIRDAVQVALGRRQVDVRVIALEDRLDALAERVERLARMLTAVAERVIAVPARSSRSASTLASPVAS